MKKKCNNCDGLGFVLIAYRPESLRRCPICKGTGKAKEKGKRKKED